MVKKMCDMWRNQKSAGAEWAMATALWATGAAKGGELRGRSPLAIHPNKNKTRLNEYQRYHYSRL